MLSLLIALGCVDTPPDRAPEKDTDEAAPTDTGPGPATRGT